MLIIIGIRHRLSNYHLSNNSRYSTAEDKGATAVPTYQYACKDCGHQFETVQSFSDDSLTVCPECGGTLRKQFGAVGVIFKGSGFYRNDSRSTTKSAASSAKPAAKSEESKPGSSGSSGKESSGNGSSTAANSGNSSSSSTSAKTPPKTASKA